MTRHLAIGDVHGCFAALQTLLAYAGVRADDVVVMLGDYVDRGPHSRQVIDWMIDFDKTHRLVPLRGNHEVMMLNARLHQSDRLRWALSGANQTLDSYAAADGKVAQITDIPESHWEFLSQRLVRYFETETHLFVHAAIDPKLPLDKQPDRMLYWEQYSDRFPGHISGKTVICGHKSQDTGIPATNGHAVCIDTRAWKNGWLSCLDVDSGTIWQANQDGDTRQLHLDELPRGPTD